MKRYNVNKTISTQNLKNMKEMIACCEHPNMCSLGSLKKAMLVKDNKMSARWRYNG